MGPALWLLLRLRLVSWARRLGRSLKTPKGILLAVLGGLFLVPLLLSVVMALLVPRSAQELEQGIENVCRFGPLLLLAYCLFSAVFVGDHVIQFAPAEVNFLFPGPFTRRQLLVYKVGQNAGGALLSAAFLLLFLRLPRHSLLAGYVGLALALLFMQLLIIALGLTIHTVGVRAYSRWRKVVLVLVLALAAAAAWHVGQDLFRLPPLEALRQMEQSPAVQVVLEPLRWFFRAYTAERLWPDLLLWTVLGLALDGGLLLVVFVLDAHYLEGAAAASEKLYARLQHLRSGGVAAMGLSGAGKPRVALPLVPWWGGAGPIAWRQLTTLLRSRGSFVFLLILGLSMVGPLIASAASRPEQGPPLEGLLAGALGGMMVFLTPFIAYDFRGDIDRMDLLKSLPIAALPLALGQLVAPVLLVTCLQWVVVVGLAVAAGRFGEFHAAAVALVVPFNAYLFGLENLLFLLFPTRLLATGPGDFQALGRKMLLIFAKVAGLGVAGGVTATCAVLVYFLAGRSVAAAVAVAWVVLAGFAVGVVPLIALAFRMYDVARDTPP